SDFQIETLTAILNADSLLVGGNVNGKLNLSGFSDRMLFDADMDITDFNFRGDSIGELNVLMHNERADFFHVDLRLNGHGNDLVMQGDYNTSTNELAMDLDTQELNISTVEAFSFGALQQSTVSISATIAISGS